MNGNLLPSVFYANKTVRVSGFSGVIYAGTNLPFTITGVINPPSTQSVAAFSVGTYRNDYVIDRSSTSPAYQATVGNLIAALAPTNPQASTSTNYAFTITLGNAITSTSRILINFPASFSLPSGNFVCSSDRSVSSPICTYTSANSIMTITSFTSTALSQGNAIVLTINGITNPSVVGQIASFTITTTYSSTVDYVDTIVSGVQFTVTPRTLSPSNIVLTSSSNIVYSQASLTFTINNFNPVLANTNIFIGFPAELIRTSSTCSVNSVGKSCS